MIKMIRRSACILGALLLSTFGAAAQGYPPASPNPWLANNDIGSTFEARFGVFAHGVGSSESGTVSLNGEFATPRLFNAGGNWWSPLIPRVHVGGFLNLSGRTDSAYMGLLWTVPIYAGFFAEGFFGGTLHNGSLTPNATHAGLGCPLLFNVGGSVGYRFNEHWSVLYTLNHMSNGRGVFGTDCGTNQAPGGNQGLNHHGIRASYSF